MHGCTFCAECGAHGRALCPNCGGTLVRRTRRAKPSEDNDVDPIGMSSWLIWAISFGTWALIAFAGSFTMYQYYRFRDWPGSFGSLMALQLSQTLTYAPLSPLVFQLACRYPIQRRNWSVRLALYAAGGLIFSLAHIVLRGMTYGVFDAKTKSYVYPVWDFERHVIRIRWDLFQSLFFLNIVDDITGTYIPIVLIAYLVAYYQRLRQRELRTSQLQTQLAKARLQTLKSQLQPHFLFNTMHSISALMLIDVRAADRMMTRLSDLLRMTLESVETQITTLSRELEFVNCYLEIEKIRFEERLNVVMDIDPATLDAQVPQLLLQPLVDNAIKHGISRLPNEGKVRIAAKSVNGELQLEIGDNGPGFGVPGLFQSKRLGLRVTRERLESLYGQEHSMELFSLPDGGGCVRICIPFRTAGSNHERRPTDEWDRSPSKCLR